MRLSFFLCVTIALLAPSTSRIAWIEHPTEAQMALAMVFLKKVAPANYPKIFKGDEIFSVDWTYADSICLSKNSEYRDSISMRIVADFNEIQDEFRVFVGSNDQVPICQFCDYSARDEAVKVKFSPVIDSYLFTAELFLPLERALKLGTSNHFGVTFLLDSRGDIYFFEVEEFPSYWVR